MKLLLGQGSDDRVTVRQAMQSFSVWQGWTDWGMSSMTHEVLGCVGQGWVSTSLRRMTSWAVVSQ